MDAFNPNPPEWTQSATHAVKFHCPSCGATAGAAERVWINRYAPVTGDNYRRKWQEFYHCHCGKVWWSWSSDRPLSPWQKKEEENLED